MKRLAGSDLNQNTIRNARVVPRVGTVASSATPTINTDLVDMYTITALSTDITSFTTNLSGTPNNGDKLWISITDNGTARAITWGASFENGAVTLPTTTIASYRLDVAFVWNAATSKWRCMSYSNPIVDTVLTDTFMGSAFESQSALVRNVTLTASTDFAIHDTLEIGSAYTLEIPATSSLEIAGYALQAAGNIGSQGLANGAVTPSKLATGASTASVSAAETSTSTTYTDLATVGPAVTVDIGVNGMALVGMRFNGQNNGTVNTSGDYFLTSFAVSGATTIAASDTRAMGNNIAGNIDNWMAGALLVTGLTAGSNTFTMKYRVGTGGTASWSTRTIWVIPL